MLPVKKILCPTDFSEPSYEALKTAIELARHFSSELLIVNVMIPVPLIPGPSAAPVTFNISEYEEELENSARKMLDKLVQERVPEDIQVRTRLDFGNPADQIVKTAEEEMVDLVVIATHGETGWKHLVFGSVAEKVIRYASHPVLTIRSPEHGK